MPKGRPVALRGQVARWRAHFRPYCSACLGHLCLSTSDCSELQSWTDPFVIITALPAALAGIVWMLFVTDTTLSVPALTGAIMSMGVATANSDPCDRFARERLDEIGDATAARTRRRIRAFAAGADDGAGDDHRHGADGAGPG